MFVKKEAVLRKIPNINSDIIDILDVNCEVSVLGKTVNNSQNEEYIKVKVNETVGYVISSSLSDDKLNVKNRLKSMSKENKIKIYLEVKKILNQNTSYSSKLNNKYYDSGKTRGNGYYNIPYLEKQLNEEYFSYDCSSLCCTIINRVFNKDMTKNDEEQTKIEIRDNEYYKNLWVTKDFLENALLDDKADKKIFKIIEHIKNSGEEIDVFNMEIGDLLVGIIDFENEKHNKKFIMNHIMIYIGDGYVAHASYTNGDIVFNRVIVTKLLNGFYTKLGFERRFDKEIALIRYID